MRNNVESSNWPYISLRMFLIWFGTSQRDHARDVRRDFPMLEDPRVDLQGFATAQPNTTAHWGRLFRRRKSVASRVISPSCVFLAISLLSTLAADATPSHGSPNYIWIFLDLTVM